MPRDIRILVVDDHFIVRLGLVDTLGAEPGLAVVGEAANGAEAVARYENLRPDLVLMDGLLPDMDGTEATRAIVAVDPAARVLFLSINETGEDVHRAMEAGAWGYVAKSSSREILIAGIRAVAAGERFLPDALRARWEERQSSAWLSARELEVLALVARGMANKQIADRLGVSDNTVKTHVAHLLRKLGVPDRAGAVAAAMERGLLRPGPVSDGGRLA
jgi:DNA-binding NarL/FixJ family response regulator